MKRIKFLLPLLAVCMLLFIPLNVKAAEQKLPSGTRKATITITLKNLLSCEGEITCKDSSGKAITFSNITAKSDKASMCGVSGTDIFMVASADPVTLTITVDIAVPADGTYYVYLDGGKTDADGKYTDYSENNAYLETVKVIVGKESSSSSGSNKEENKDDNKDDNKGSSSSSGSSDNKKEESNTSDKDKKDDKVDYTQLEQALKDADKVIEENSELNELINDRNNATMLLNSEDQEQIDEAANALQEKVSDMDKKGENGSSFDFGKVLKIAAPILLLTIIVVVALLMLRRSKKKEGTSGDYEGAPMVDYDIGDDD